MGTEPISQGNWAAIPIFPALFQRLTVVWGISCSTQECPCQQQSMSERFGAIHQTLFKGSAIGQHLALHPHLFLNSRHRTERRDLSRACQWDLLSFLLPTHLAKSDKEKAQTAQSLDITEANQGLAGTCFASWKERTESRRPGGPFLHCFLFYYEWSLVAAVNAQQSPDHTHF